MVSPSLAPGAGEREVFAGPACSGRFQVTAVADPNGQVDDRDRADNTLTWTVQGLPDPATLGKAMKTEIHPEYVDAHVRCTCGNEFMTRSTKPEIHVEICSACHPFYTGRQKLVDTGGRVERFQRRVAKGRRAAARRLGRLAGRFDG